MLFHRWYIDDSVVAGPISAVLCVLSIVKDLGPPILVFISICPSANYLVSMTSICSQMKLKKCNVPHFDILRAPIGDFLFCAKYVAQKCMDASKLLQQLAQVGSSDPHVAMLLLHQCESFYRLIHWPELSHLL